MERNQTVAPSAANEEITLGNGLGKSLGKSLLAGLLLVSLSIVISVYLVSLSAIPGLPFKASVGDSNPFRIETLLVIFPLILSAETYLRSDAAYERFSPVGIIAMRDLTFLAFLFSVTGAFVGELLKSPRLDGFSGDESFTLQPALRAVGVGILNTEFFLVFLLVVFAFYVYFCLENLRTITPRELDDRVQYAEKKFNESVENLRLRLNSEAEKRQLVFLFHRYRRVSKWWQALIWLVVVFIAEAAAFGMLGGLAIGQLKGQGGWEILTDILPQYMKLFFVAAVAQDFVDLSPRRAKIPFIIMQAFLLLYLCIHLIIGLAFAAGESSYKECLALVGLFIAPVAWYALKVKIWRRCLPQVMTRMDESKSRCCAVNPPSTLEEVEQYGLKSECQYLKTKSKDEASLVFAVEIPPHCKGGLNGLMQEDVESNSGKGETACEHNSQSAQPSETPPIVSWLWWLKMPRRYLLLKLVIANLQLDKKQADDRLTELQRQKSQADSTVE